MKIKLLLFLVTTLVVSSLLADTASDYEAGIKAYQEEDLINAMSLLERASAQGHTGAKVLLAYILDKANEHERAALLYREAAEAGDPAAEMGLAQLYAIGQGVERDISQANRLMTNAAEKGHAPAMMVLAEAYERGELGFSVDPQQSRDWLRKAAEAGSDEARLLLESSEQ